MASKDISNELLQQILVAINTQTEEIQIQNDLLKKLVEGLTPFPKDE